MAHWRRNFPKLHKDLTITGHIGVMRLVHRQSDTPPPLPPSGGTTLPGSAGDGHPVPDAANESPARLNDSERESLLLNIDVSLRVHTRPQLFSWVQGALHSLIPHEVL